VLLGPFLQIAGVAASVAIGLIFLVAGIDKLRHRAVLPGVIANYRLVPAALVTPVAWLLPVVEIIVAAGLLVGSRAAAIGAIVLLLVFAAAMAINIQRGRRHIDCGCGQAALRQTLGWGLVGRNLLLALALAARLPATVDLDGAAIAIAALAGFTMFLLMQMFNAINALPPKRASSTRGWNGA
jgi:Methylamine utilisation protein MauE